MNDKQPSNRVLGESEESMTPLRQDALRKRGGAPEAPVNLEELFEQYADRTFKRPGMDYLQGTTNFAVNLPATIEDEIPPVSQAFADKVKAEGGRITALGIVRDPSFKVEGKRYLRLAKAFYCTMFSPMMAVVEDAEFHILRYAKRDKTKPDWEGQHAYFARCLKVAFKARHRPTRDPIYYESTLATKDLLPKPELPFKPFPGDEK